MDLAEASIQGLERAYMSTTTTQRPHHRLAAWLLSGLTATALLVGCGDPEPEPDSPETTAQATLPQEPAPPPPKPKVDPYPAFVDRVAAPISERALAAAENGQAAGMLEERVNRRKRRRNDNLSYRPTLRDIYQGQGARLHFVRGGQLTEDGQKVLELLQDAHNHGLGQRVFHLPDLEQMAKRLADDAEKERDPITLSEADKEALADALRERNIDTEGEDAVDHAVAIALGPDSPTPALIEAARDRGAKLKDLVEDAVVLELTMADAVARYVWEMRYNNKAWFDEELFKDKNKIQQRRTLVDLLGKDLAKRFAEGDVSGFMQSVIPTHDQYARLITALARYRAIADNGGWEKLKKRSLRKGMRGKVVLSLKRRLAAEGFYPPPEPGMERDLSVAPTVPSDEALGDKFDDTLLAAVHLYQRTHQIKEEDSLSWLFWKSIRVPIEERIEQIKLTLGRWRESNITDDSYYVFVNIPDFHAEAWRDGVREMRFRIVVGNTKFGCDENDGRWKRINATPTQSNEIRSVIVNPYWNIPERIRKEEILPAAKENPNYFEANGYECVKRRGDECVRVRQASGEDNALGRVKFIFPNFWNTYMHDTPKKHFFNFPTRAFSHGCMRVKDPLNFAEYLLKNDGSWDDDEFQRRLNTKKEHPYQHKQRVPIHIEYYTVRVDDDGHVNFLSDLYMYDHYRMKGEELSWRRCTEEELAYARNPGEDDGTEDDTGTSEDEGDGDAATTDAASNDDDGDSDGGIRVIRIKQGDDNGDDGDDGGGGDLIIPTVDKDDDDKPSRPSFRKITIKPN